MMQHTSKGVGFGRSRLLAGLRGSIVVIASVLLLAAHGAPAEDLEAPVKTVKVSAERFHFVPSRIKVARGERLEIELTSRDVEHGFRIVDTEINVRIPEAGGGSVKVVFDAQAKGRYRFECSNQCGAGHASMSGVIVVKGGPK